MVEPFRVHCDDDRAMFEKLGKQIFNLTWRLALIVGLLVGGGILSKDAIAALIGN